MGLNYKNAGVDIDAGNELVEQIKPAIKSTHRPEVLSNIGGFGGLFALQANQYKQPILVSGTDGVGTKLRLAQRMNMHSTIGIDLVAMCVNDVIVQGAEPLFFLDYYATGKLSIQQAKAVVEGIAEGCRQSNAALIGGETAEMPTMYKDDEYDLAGFCVGIVDKDNLIDGSAIRAGDIIVGLPSSGIHSNGFSLVNKVLETNNVSLDKVFDDGKQNKTLGEVLLQPTIIYTKVILDILSKINLHGLCHITGGGLVENVPRVIPNGCTANIKTSAWERPAIFSWLQKMGHIDESEMLRVFNCGLGMLLFLPPEHAEHVIEISAQHNHAAKIIGEISASNSTNKIALK